MINEEVNRRLGGIHSARLILYSLDFGEVAALLHAGRFPELEKIMIEAGKKLELAGVDLILLAANTTHMFDDAFEKAVSTPLVHIADAAAEEMRRRGCKTAGLLGTKFTMQMDFYKTRLKRSKIECLVPNPEGMERIDKIIYDELACGQVRDDSRDFLLNEIGALKKRGAQAIILGCTELSMILDQSRVDIPLLDTAKLHVLSAVGKALD